MTGCVLDITELLRNPMRTGIQRVVRELIRHWPDENLTLARFDRRLRPVSRDVIPLLLDTDPRAKAATVSELAAMLDAAAGPAKRLPLAPILVPEVCHKHRRWAWYDGLGKREPDAFSMLVFDFIPWLHKHLYSIQRDPQVAPYFELVGRANRLAFISAATRDDAARIGRPNAGPVFAPGADGLRMERQTFDPAKRSWIVIGSVCRNKGHDIVLDAFEALWSEGFTGKLIFVGRNADDDLAALLRAARALPLFQHLPDASDADLGNVLRQARATISISHVEGYGLAPVESLYLGIPTIVTASIPSVRDLPSAGQLRLSVPSREGLIAAIRELSDDEAARRLWAGTGDLTLPTWGKFAADIAAWMSRAPRRAGLLQRLWAR